MDKKQIIYFSTRNELSRIDLSEVMLFEADSNYTDVRFRGAHTITLLASLNSIELVTSNIEDTPFLRIGRKHIINMNYLTHINIQKSQLILSDNATSCTLKLTISHESLKKLKKTINESKARVIENFNASNCNMVAFTTDETSHS